jgi:hypothetical protein
MSADERAKPAAGHVYVGRRHESGCRVKVDGVRLSLHLHVMRHSPTGFEWGYAGSGPAQLALAILANHFGRGVGARNRALRLHQQFKGKVIQHLPHEGWTLTSEEVASAVAELEAGR